MRDEAREGDELQAGIPAPRAATPGPVLTGSDHRTQNDPTRSNPTRNDSNQDDHGVTQEASIDDYAVRLAALKAYDITGVRPGDLHHFRSSGTLPHGVPQAVLLRAQRILEEERSRLLKLAESGS